MFSPALVRSSSDMSDKKSDCNLCGLSIEILGFTLNTPQGVKVFCCEGCKSIFKLLNEARLLADLDKN